MCVLGYLCPNVGNNACVDDCSPDFLSINEDKCVEACDGIYQIRTAAGNGC